MHSVPEPAQPQRSMPATNKGGRHVGSIGHGEGVSLLVGTADVVSSRRMEESIPDHQYGHRAGRWPVRPASGRWRRPEPGRRRYRDRAMPDIHSARWRSRAGLRRRSSSTRASRRTIRRPTGWPTRPIYERAVYAPCRRSSPSWRRSSARPRSSGPTETSASAGQVPVQDGDGGVTGGGWLHPISAAGLGVGSGMYMMASGPARALPGCRGCRRAGRSRLVGSLRQAREEGHRGERSRRLKTAPKGYPKDHPRIELLRYKGLVAWQQWPPGAVARDGEGEEERHRLPAGVRADERVVGGARGAERRWPRAARAEGRRPALHHPIAKQSGRRIGDLGDGAVEGLLVGSGG